MFSLWVVQVRVHVAIHIDSNLDYPLWCNNRGISYAIICGVLDITTLQLNKRAIPFKSIMHFSIDPVQLSRSVHPHKPSWNCPCSCHRFQIRSMYKGAFVKGCIIRGVFGKCDRSIQSNIGESWCIATKQPIAPIQITTFRGNRLLTECHVNYSQLLLNFRSPFNVWPSANKLTWVRDKNRDKKGANPIGWKC